MLRIKRLYIYVLQAFLPMFFMTFAICLFILLMQFLWKYIEDLVGKGLDNLVLAELFFYATLSIIPMALPLAILLASLMTFGNLGERFELLAIKAAGISLFRTMRPLIVLMICISVGAFYFQNEAMPKINVKITSLMRSIKMKSPELDIPEGSFYNDIDNYNLYVKSKNKETGMLYGVKIYDVSKGFDNMAVIVCDSAKIRMSSGKDYLLLSLFSGQQFSNFQKPGSGTNYNYPKKNNSFVPYGRENFQEKNIIIQFDATFNRMDESSLQGTQIAKNIRELEASIDSLSTQVDSLNKIDRRAILTQFNKDTYYVPTENNQKKDDKLTAKSFATFDVDSLLGTFSVDKLATIYSGAASRITSTSSDLTFRSYPKMDAQYKIRQHKVVWHQKFTLSFACIIFFFIGAPLGAIIRKGGLGMPVVISVILFIVYYIIDNVGRKMARDGVWLEWQGIWLSSAILFPLGVFLTYKAMNDSTLFNVEAYNKIFRKILKIKTKLVSHDEPDVNSEDIKPLTELIVDRETIGDLQKLDSPVLKDIIKNYREYKYDRKIQPVALAILKERGENLFGVKLMEFDYDAIKTSLSSFTRNGWISIALYVISLILFVLKFTNIGIIAAIIYLIFTTRASFYYSDFYSNTRREHKTNKTSLKILGLYILSIFIFPFLRRDMKKEMDNVFDK